MKIPSVLNFVHYITSKWVYCNLNCMCIEFNIVILFTLFFGFHIYGAIITDLQNVSFTIIIAGKCDIMLCKFYVN